LEKKALANSKPPFTVLEIILRKNIFLRTRILGEAIMIMVCSVRGFLVLTV
jgi:hypothetical protein